MPPIEVGPARAATAIDARLARAAGGESLPGANGVAANRSANKASATASPAVETSGALDPGEAPVDAERVEDIRKAVESGTYPLIPAKIADAMIAAGVLLRSPKQ
ncbi:negative regulator of flagellin synthesis FlgM [Novosphingobium sp. CF614]|uniref:flagellar biosynthesis anti-sigma factor FlgM n=1 Tax=Novosphingobium sp. CF614 TaxID=1884364 RepID=UPI0008EE9A2E|nr:flagellar biosynthesis anti-sigma factor FlgM [Novosphingobium sp. CF614]SFF75826.1 negative regulator of flagellin synthesis FlgM [Novosphingobium sp. CF614]